MTNHLLENHRRRVCVFCASNIGATSEYQAEAARFGALLAQSGFGLVYGGAQVGLMGALADAALAAGGEVLGVIPRALETRELSHRGLTALYVVETMHERKAKMGSLADAFVALPGGFGTLAEFFEAVTWRQLGIHSKPCLLVNTEGYFDSLIRFLDLAVERGFVQPRNRSLIQACASAREAISCLEHAWDEGPLDPIVSTAVAK